jgi:hypothetical protein
MKKAAIIVWAVLLLGCQAARMPVPETLATAEGMKVSGRQGLRLNETIRFGAYEASPIERSWTRGRDRGATAVARDSERIQSYRFTFREGDVAHWFVACRAAVESVRIDLGVVDVHPSDQSTLYCNLQSTSDRLVAWELELAERRGRPLSGTLTRGDRGFDIVGTNRVAGALPLDATTGYEIREGPTAVGAVEVINHGAVWLSPGLDPAHRPVLAAASAALLLLEDLYASIDDQNH